MAWSWDFGDGNTSTGQNPSHTTANDGFESDAIGNRGQGAYTYQVCEAGTLTCSEVVTVTF